MELDEQIESERKGGDKNGKQHISGDHRFRCSFPESG